MKGIKYLLIILLTAFFAASACQMKPDSYSIKGSVNGAANLKVVLEQLFFDQNTAPKVFTRVSCDANGNFTLEQKEPFQKGLYRLTIGAKRMYFILGGDETAVEFKGDLGTLDRYEMEVAGSETFTCYTKAVQELLKSTQLTPETAKVFVDKSCNPLMRAYLTLQFFGRNAVNHLEDFKSAEKILSEDMPESTYAKEFSKIVSTLETQMKQQNIGAEIRVGQAAPEISLPGPDGKLRNLSAMKGKVVLLDFWASWCRPCRMANPHVVEIYNKYKDKGFDVYSVSLDRPGQKDAWVTAIKQDGLTWDNHVSDLQYWSSMPAAVYGVRAIPSTFLIDREGNIAAINPRTDLEAQLLKIL